MVSEGFGMFGIPYKVLSEKELKKMPKSNHPAPPPLPTTAAPVPKVVAPEVSQAPPQVTEGAKNSNQSEGNGSVEIKNVRKRVTSKNPTREDGVWSRQGVKKLFDHRKAPHMLTDPKVGPILVEEKEKSRRYYSVAEGKTLPTMEEFDEMGKNYFGSEEEFLKHRAKHPRRKSEEGDTEAESGGKKRKTKNPPSRDDEVWTRSGVKVIFDHKKAPHILLDEKATPTGPVLVEETSGNRRYYSLAEGQTLPTMEEFAEIGKRVLGEPEFNKYNVLAAKVERGRPAKKDSSEEKPQSVSDADYSDEDDDDDDDEDDD